MNTLEILKAARALIEKPEHWSKGAFARDPRGNGVSPINKTAVCWCAAGSVRNVGLISQVELYAALGVLRTALPAEAGRLAGVITFNDRPDTTHADIIALFDRAIAEYAKAVQS